MDTARLISIIVPVYNVREYLDRCIESIVHQTYRELEIILVDDGSTDDSGSICDQWAEKDSRIQVIHKPNGGLSDARNAGLREARGEMIGFVDSDDYIHREMFSRLLEIMRREGSDIVECEMQRFFESSDVVTEIQPAEIRTYDNHGAVEQLLLERWFHHTAPTKVYRRSTVKGILFETGKINEDVLWSYRAFHKANKVTYTGEPLYYYYQRMGSIMNTAYTEKRFHALDALQQRAEYIRKDYPALYPLALRLYAGACMYHYQTLSRNRSEDKDRRLRTSIIHRYRAIDSHVFFKATSFKYQIWHTVFRALPDFVCRARNLLRIGVS